MGAESLLESPLGFQHLKHWDKLMASEFIIPLRNIAVSSVINNLGLVVRAGVGREFMCLLGRVGEDFSILLLKYPMHCQPQTLHISHFAVPHSVPSLEMQHDTSNFFCYQIHEWVQAIRKDKCIVWAPLYHHLKATLLN